MSTGAAGNGLETPATYTARVRTYAVGDIVHSADLNDAQDRVVDVSEAVETAHTAAVPFGTASGDQADVPAPTTHGSRAVWLEKATNGTTVVVLDDEADWRDRFLVVALHGVAASYAPGGANDNILSADLLSTGQFVLAYTEAGQDGTAIRPGAEWAQVADRVRLFARNTDGALCLVKDAAVDGDLVWFGLVVGSPLQNHY